MKTKRSEGTRQPAAILMNYVIYPVTLHLLTTATHAHFHLARVHSIALMAIVVFSIKNLGIRWYSLVTLSAATFPTSRL